MEDPCLFFCQDTPFLFSFFFNTPGRIDAGRKGGGPSFSSLIVFLSSFSPVPFAGRRKKHNGGEQENRTPISLLYDFSFSFFSFRKRKRPSSPTSVAMFPPFLFFFFPPGNSLNMGGDRLGLALLGIFFCDVLRREPSIEE